MYIHKCIVYTLIYVKQTVFVLLKLCFVKSAYANPTVLDVIMHRVAVYRSRNVLQCYSCIE